MNSWRKCWVVKDKWPFPAGKGLWILKLHRLPLTQQKVHQRCREAQDSQTEGEGDEGRLQKSWWPWESWSLALTDGFLEKSAHKEVNRCLFRGAWEEKRSGDSTWYEGLTKDCLRSLSSLQSNPLQPTVCVCSHRDGTSTHFTDSN